jgi:hypothetical protein
MFRRLACSVMCRREQWSHRVNQSGQRSSLGHHSVKWSSLVHKSAQWSNNVHPSAR